MTTAIPRGARSAHVYERLRDLIVRGRLAPGGRVVEQEVAERMGVGRTPVREALQLLVKEGLLVASEGGRRQLTVAPLRADDAAELFGLLGDLEAAAVRGLPALTPPARTALAAGAHAASQAFAHLVRTAPVDLEAAFVARKAFHASITDPLAGPRLAWLLSLVRPQVDRYEWLYGALLQDALALAAAEHEAVVRALAAGDASGAEAAVRASWKNAGARVGGVIDRIGERGAG
ncbi:GntR family transcriptional regulator [Longimicrobium sp.]|jgi:DNA-binding GntR family transcriptional regulator|uniref:GntR family transcriptional regulator n=1 Tax=Longimicrobium sp. TaxID=2029185 RepID=UPI002F91FBCD